MDSIKETIEAAKGTWHECKDAITHKVSRLTPAQRVFIKGAVVGAAVTGVVVGGVVIYKKRKGAQ